MLKSVTQRPILVMQPNTLKTPFAAKDHVWNALIIMIIIIILVFMWYHWLYNERGKVELALSVPLRMTV